MKILLNTNFFTNIGSSLANFHPEIYLSNSNPKTFLFPTNETEILKIVGKLKKNRVQDMMTFLVNYSKVQLTIS